MKIKFQEKFMKIRTILLLSALSLTACAHGNRRDAVMKRAQFDLDCPAEKLTLSDIGDETIGASGCSKKAAYVFQGNCSGGFAECTPVLNGDVKSSK